MKRYSTREGEITIPLFDKDNKRVLDLKKYKEENNDDNNIYDKNGNIIKDKLNQKTLKKNQQ